MAKITYTLLDREFNSIPENENYSSADLNLIDSFEINKNYKPERHYIESHFYSLNNEKIFSVYDYKLNTSTETSAEGDITSLSLEPEKLSIENGFTGVDHKIVFHFLNDLYTYTSDKQRFYINSISQDRTEILLYSDKIDVNRIINITEDLKEKISNESYFEEYWLNLGDNDLFIVTNIDVFELDDKYTVALKLYEPLPERFELKYEAQLVEKISDSLVVEVQVDVEEEPEVFPKLRQANFDVELDLNTPTPTQYFNYDELFSYSNLNSNREIFSYINENSVDININYSNYENFINFSSAKERLENFKYKVQLLQTYQSSKDQISNSTNNSGSSAHYDNLIKGVVDNFDHYEKFLYFESGSNSWPKSTSVKPHVNLHSTSTEAISWYANQLTSASNYDVSNYDLLANALPSYIAEDTNNSSAVLFTHMIGQHFDNLWIYTKAVTDKYNNDNRVDVGISKDLVRDALTSLGTKLYNSAEGTNDLFRYIISDTYDSGSIEEIVNTFIEVPNIPTDRQPISRKNYEGELYKRIYHNLPFLLKSKGTERGLRALINCFGIPSDFLTIKQYGGQIIGSDKFLGYEGESTGSISKVRYETRVSGSVGRVLTQDKSIQKTEEDKTQDIHRLEVGFSPSDSINDYILSQLPSSFNIDDYIGDPRDMNKGQYFDLMKEAHRVLHASVERTQLNDFVRILKFYDNVLFKMIKDFIPAKATLDAGIIIKPHILNRSKVKSPDLSGTRPEYTGSIDTAFIEGGSAGVYEIGGINIPIELDIEAKWKPGKVGGISNFSFQPDYHNPTATNPGEITIWGTEFYPPNGEAVTFEDRYMTVYTPYEGTFSQRLDFYLMYTSESVTDRFNINTSYTRQHPNIIAVDYFENDDTWRARDNNGSTTVTFTPLDTDVIIAAASFTATDTIGYFINFTKPLITKRPGEKSTLHRLDIKTKQGSTVKWVEDEAPKINGELSGSIIQVTDGELNRDNIFKQINVPVISYDIIARDAGSGADYSAFSLSTVNSTVSAENACININSFTTAYFNGEGALPTIGDYVFDGINDATGKDGSANWWLAKDINSSTYAILISGSDNLGYVGDVINCSTFDNTPPSGYTATWNMVPQNILANNSISVPFIIYNAEVGATYNVTASLESAPNTKATTSGTITGGGSLTNFSSSIDCSTLADGENVLLDVTLVDTNNNRGGLAPVGPNIANTLTASFKDTSTPSGYSILFTSDFQGTAQTTNTDGYFNIRISNLPQNDNGTIYYNLTSTGGGQSYSNSTSWNTSLGSTTKDIYIPYYSHNLTSGTVTVQAYVADTPGNIGAFVTDTVIYSLQSGTITPVSSTAPYDLNYWSQVYYINVNITPNNGQWYLEAVYYGEDTPFINVSSTVRTGDLNNVGINIDANTESYGRFGDVNLIANGSGDILDTISFYQNEQSCVAPHTLILMGDGTLKKAGDIQVGDVVKTKHESTLEDVNAPITLKQIRTDKRVKVTIGNKEIVCTPNHRFYVDNRQAFVEAQELQEGDILSEQHFISIEEYEAGEIVKLTVERAHTYISEGILSHNFKYN